MPNTIQREIGASLETKFASTVEHVSAGRPLWHFDVPGMLRKHRSLGVHQFRALHTDGFLTEKQIKVMKIGGNEKFRDPTRKERR